jgi:hypothetical protein
MFKRYLAPVGLILGFGIALALAQTANQGMQVSQDPTSPVGYDSVQGGIYLPGHLLTTNRKSVAPVISACGTGTPTVVGTDFAGVITTGSGASTACTITFGTAYQTAPNCQLTAGASMALTAAMQISAVSASAFTATYASSTSAKLFYLCVSAS